MSIEEAKALLEDSGYVVIKCTEEMDTDCGECHSMSVIGKEKNCMTCSNTICLSEYINRQYN